MKKNSFLTFCFAMLPGAGQMYLGLMKKGVSIMSIFFGIIVLAAAFNFVWIVFLLPVIWFYAFFDAINYNNMSSEKKELAEDKFLFDDRELSAFIKNNRTLVGVVCVVLGLCIIYNSVIYDVIQFFSNDVIIKFLRNIPTVAVSFCIILFGIGLIKNKKEEDDDFKEFGKTDKKGRN